MEEESRNHEHYRHQAPRGGHFSGRRVVSRWRFSRPSTGPRRLWDQPWRIVSTSTSKSRRSWIWRSTALLQWAPAQASRSSRIGYGDLNTLAEANVATRNKLDADLGKKTALIILAARDPERFPWLFSDPPRSPTAEERRLAMRWTVGLKAAAETQTSRRGEASRGQERMVSELLLSLGFEQVPPRPIER